MSRTPEENRSRVIEIVAGQQAVNRWLRESGLWTPSLAALADLGAAHDRAVVLDVTTPCPVFGGGGADYGYLHALAGEVLDAVWNRITVAVPVLVGAGRLTGDELAACVGLVSRHP